MKPRTRSTMFHGKHPSDPSEGESLLLWFRAPWIRTRTPRHRVRRSRVLPRRVLLPRSSRSVAHRDSTSPQEARSVRPPERRTTVLPLFPHLARRPPTVVVFHHSMVRPFSALPSSRDQRRAGPAFKPPSLDLFTSRWRCWLVVLAECSRIEEVLNSSSRREKPRSERLGNRAVRLATTEPHPGFPSPRTSLSVIAGPPPHPDAPRPQVGDRCLDTPYGIQPAPRRFVYLRVDDHRCSPCHSRSARSVQHHSTLDVSDGLSPPHAPASPDAPVSRVAPPASRDARSARRHGPISMFPVKHRVSRSSAIGLLPSRILTSPPLSRAAVLGLTSMSPCFHADRSVRVHRASRRRHRHRPRGLRREAASMILADVRTPRGASSWGSSGRPRSCRGRRPGKRWPSAGSRCGKRGPSG